MTSRHILLTGATGLVGQYLLRDMLIEGMPVAVVVRSLDGQSAAERIEEVLARWEAEMSRTLPRPVCLEGDITVPALGLNAEDRRWLKENCGSVLHNAASLKFFGTDRNQDPWLSNMTGTVNVLELCREANISDFHYMSTAYVCGAETGLVREIDLDRGQKFHNDYEQCKFEVEKLVRGSSFLNSLTVYRPAVIIGDSRTGWTNTYHGLYSYFQFVWFYCQLHDCEREANGLLHLPARLNLTGEEGRNLVPVDWVSAVTTYLLSRPEHHGKTYHLVPRQSVKARFLEEAMCKHFHYYGPTFAGPDALAGSELNELEKMFYEYVQRYQPYWNEEPKFDCTNTLTAAPQLPCPEIDLPMLLRMIEFAEKDRWGKRKSTRPARKREEAATE